MSRDGWDAGRNEGGAANVLMRKENIMEMFDGFPWALVTIVGAFVLLAAIGYGMWANSKRTNRERMLTEMATWIYSTCIL